MENNNTADRFCTFLSFSDVNTDNGTMDIYMVNELELGGFQIDVSGLNITSASGGIFVVGMWVFL